jgi:hypothetical protein
MFAVRDWRAVSYIPAESPNTTRKFHALIADRSTRTRLQHPQWLDLAKFNVERFGFRRRNRQRVFDKALGNGHRVGKIQVAANGIRQEKVVTAEGALIFRRRKATKSPEIGQAHKVDERLPIAFDTACRNWAKFQQSKGRRAEQPHRIKNRPRVLQRQVAVFEAEQFAKRFIRGRHFDSLRRGKGLRQLGLGEEVQSSLLRKFLWTAKAHDGRRGRVVQLRALGEDADSRPRRKISLPMNPWQFRTLQIA